MDDLPLIPVRSAGRCPELVEGCGVRKTGHNDGARLDMVSNIRIVAIARRDAAAL